MIKGTKLYKVTISDGKVDPKPYNHYEDFDSDQPTGSLEDYLEKAKALYRWYVMSMNLQKGLETLSNIEAEATSITVPEEVSFVLTYTQPDALWIDCEEGTEGAKEISKGRFIVEGEDAIKKIIEDTLDKEYGDEKVICAFASQFNPDKITKTSEFMPYSDLPLGESFRGIVVEASQPIVVVEEILEYKQFESDRA